MIQALYLNDAYLQEFEAKVMKADGKFVILDRTVFYPSSGGQPHDTGSLYKGQEEYKVVYVKKMPEGISHELDKEGLQEGETIKGKIDWQRRYKLMKMHTASHLLASIFYKTGALITGNQLGTEKSRIDFSLEAFDKEKINEYIKEANNLIQKGAEIKTYWIKRQEALQEPELAKLAKGLPNLQQIRIVEIQGIDKQADGGTHVKNLKEIGKIEFLKAENKGKNNRRVYFKLTDF